MNRALLRMRCDIQQVILIPDDLEVESPVAIYARLPDVSRASVFLGTERWMAKVGEEESGLLPEGLLHDSRCPTQAPVEAFRLDQFH